MEENITDAMWDEAFCKALEYEKELRKEFLCALEYYKDNSILSREELEDGDNEDTECFTFDDGDYSHFGYCTVEHVDYKERGYGNYEFYKVTMLDSDTIMPRSFMRQDSGKFHNMVWQTVGYLGDDYTGYILFPMRDGRYWVVSFSIQRKFNQITNDMRFISKLNSIFGFTKVKDAEGAEVWIVSWSARNDDRWTSRRVAKAFLLYEDAKAFAKSLEEAQELLQHHEGLGIRIEKQK